MLKFLPSPLANPNTLSCMKFSKHSSRSSILPRPLETRRKHSGPLPLRKDGSDQSAEQTSLEVWQEAATEKNNFLIVIITVFAGLWQKQDVKDPSHEELRGENSKLLLTKPQHYDFLHPLSKLFIHQQ